MSRLGIDARVLARRPHHGLGVWRYLVRILERMPRDASVTVTLFGDAPRDVIASYPFAAAVDYVHVTPPFGVGSDALWEQVGLPMSGAFRRLDAFWSPSYSTPLVSGLTRVLTMHDISFDQPPPGDVRAGWRMRTIGRRSAHAADLVLTDSQFSATQMVDFWHLPASRIEVIPLAADPPAAGWQARADETFARLGVQPPYVLHVGTMYSRRHVRTLLAAMGDLLPVYRDWQLVVVGRNRTSPVEPLEETMAAINAREGRPAVRHVPFAEDADLEVLYGGAGVFAYLSSLEGFGIPPLEAMAYGVPVVSTEGGSLREFTPGAAVLVDPTRVADVRAAVGRLMESADARQAQRALSLARAAEYSWDRCASETWRAIAAVMR